MPFSISMQWWHSLFNLQSLNLDGRWGPQMTPQQCVSILLYLQLPTSSDRFAKFKSCPVLGVVSHLYLCPPLLLVPFTVPHIIFFTMSLRLEVAMLADCIQDLITDLLISYIIFLCDIQKPSKASHLKGLDSSFQFC